MTQKSLTRPPQRTKAELREMLAEAVRNTQPSTDRRPKGSPKPKEGRSSHEPLRGNVRRRS